MPEFIDRLEQKMQEAGFYYNGKINWFSPKFQRFSRIGHKNRSKDLFVKLFPGGISFGDWHHKDDKSSWDTVFEDNYSEMALEKKIALQQQRKSEQHASRGLQSDAIYRSKLLLSHKTWRGITCPVSSFDHPYIIKKKITPYYSQQFRSCLIVPIHNINHELHSLQFIKPDGFKRFKKNTSSKGSMCWLSENLADNYKGHIYLCEGYATGCTIKEIVPGAVFCSMGASNLEDCAVNLRKKFVKAIFHICADNDQYILKNVGLTAARKALSKTGGMLHYPEFKEHFLQYKPTDFNDLLCLENWEETEKQLLEVKN